MTHPREIAKAFSKIIKESAEPSRDEIDVPASHEEAHSALSSALMSKPGTREYHLYMAKFHAHVADHCKEHGDCAQHHIDCYKKHTAAFHSALAEETHPGSAELEALATKLGIK